MTAAAGLDPIIHSPARLRIMATLTGSPGSAPLDFKQLRALLGLTDGNLGAHLATLETAGFVEISKEFVGKRPRTRVLATPVGRRMFAMHVAALRAILDGAEALEMAERATGDVR